MIAPNFFLVGAPKSGTTALYSYLRQHPEIFLPSLKEPQFFAEDVLGDLRNIRTWPEYQACFAGAVGKKRIGEASVCYLGSPSAAQRIRECNPHARILIMLRHPVDMMHALHSERRFDNEEPVADFLEALQADESARTLAARGLSRPPGLPYRDMAQYARHIRTYLEAFSRENVQIVLFDDFQRNPAAVYRDVLRFLDVSPDDRHAFPIVHGNRRARSTRLQRFLEHPPNSLRQVIRQLTPQRLRRLAGGSIYRLNLAYEPRSPLNRHVRQRLLRELEPEIAELSALLDRDLSAWVAA